MRKGIVYVLLTALLMTLAPDIGHAAQVTLQAAQSVERGGTLVLSGSAPSGSDVILSVKAESGEIVFVDTAKANSSSAYRVSVTVPSSWAVGTYTAAAVANGVKAEKTFSVRAATSSLPPQAPPADPPAGQQQGNGNVTQEQGRASIGVTATVENGKVTAVVNTEQLKQAVTAVTAGSGGKTSLVLKVEGSQPAAGSTQLELPKEAAEALLTSGVSAVTVETSVGSLTFDKKSLEAIGKGLSGDVSISIAAVSQSVLPAAAQAAVGSRPVFDFTVNAGGVNISDFGGGMVKVNIPYQPSANEDVNAIVIYYIADDGSLTLVPNAVYDAASGTVTFGVKHFSKYGVGYRKVSFGDVSGWSEPYVTYLASRGVVSGVAEDRFAPKREVTRAEMAALLAKLEGIDTAGYKGSSFTDVAASAWHAPYIQWAMEAGIVSGSGGKYRPADTITREELAVMIYRYAAYAGLELPAAGAQYASFADSSQISGWAADAVRALQQAGIISGTSGNRFNPQGTATREEAAKMIAVLLQYSLA